MIEIFFYCSTDLQSLLKTFYQTKWQKIIHGMLILLLLKEISNNISVRFVNTLRVYENMCSDYDSSWHIEKKLDRSK